MKLSHLDENGSAIIVDVTDKKETDREARAAGRILLTPEIIDLIIAGDNPKGDVLAAARIAGIMAVKKTSDLIPLCHPLMLTSVKVELEAEGIDCVRIVARCKLAGQTGVEMEALTGVSTALLTIYDMCKAMDRGMVIRDIHIQEKDGGKSGHYIYQKEEK